MIKTHFNRSSLFLLLTVDFFSVVSGHKLPAKCECFFADDCNVNLKGQSRQDLVVLENPVNVLV